MTKLDYSKLGSSLNTQWNDVSWMSHAFDPYNNEISGRSSTKFTVTYATGITMKFTGTNLKYDNNDDHIPHAGSITSVKVIIAGETAISLSDFKVDVSTIRPLYENVMLGNYSAITQLLLKGDDVIRGAQGNDYIKGFGGDDKIFGNAGQDELYGAKGDDTINGGLNNDTLSGGQGKDHFVFSTALGSNNKDTIVDFSAVNDTIDLDNAIFTTLGASGHTLAQSAFTVWGAGDKLDASDRILYVKSTGDLYYDPDGSGVMGATKFAHIEGSPTLTHSDFYIV